MFAFLSTFKFDFVPLESQIQTQRMTIYPFEIKNFHTALYNKSLDQMEIFMFESVWLSLPDILS